MPISKRKLWTNHAAIQAKTSAALWTPANLSLTPRVMIDSRDAVWSGSNLSSINCTGTNVGAMTLTGTPVKGTAQNGLDPIKVTADSIYLSRTLTAWGASGKLSVFWFGKMNTSGVNGLLSYSWFGLTNPQAVIYANLDDSTGAGVYANGNRDNSGGANTDLHPDFLTSTANNGIPDTTGCHSVYAQLGSTNAFYSDGTSLTLSTSNTGTCPNYGTGFPFKFFVGGAGGGESLLGDSFVVALFDDFLGTTDRQKMEGYWAHATAQTANLPGGHPYKTTPPTV